MEETRYTLDEHGEVAVFVPVMTWIMMLNAFINHKCGDRVFGCDEEIIMPVSILISKLPLCVQREDDGSIELGAVEHFVIAHPVKSADDPITVDEAGHA